MSDQLSGATRLFPIIGDPIRYVESPIWLTRTFAERGHDAACVPMQVAQADLEVVMAGLGATANVDGILVTMPHKHAALAYCTTSSERSRLLGSVSVLRRTADGGWHGDMLDGLAVVAAQREQGAQLEGTRALLVGAGGAGSAIADALLEAGVGELVIHDEDDGRTSRLIELLADRHGDRVSVGPPDPTGFDLVLNATPLGMEEGDPLPVDVAQLRSSMFVGDVIAGHDTTPFIAGAQEAGCRTANGGDMVHAVQTLMADFMLDE